MAGPRQEGLGLARRWWSLAVIAVAQLMVVLDVTIVGVALPRIQTGLKMSPGERQWVVTAYTLTFAGLLLLGGRLGDYLGRKRALLVAVIGFGFASAAGGAAVDPVMLVMARASQGVFAALLAPAVLALIATVFVDPRERGIGFAVFGAVSAGGAAVGLLAGGGLTEYLGWRAVFYVNVPVALLAAAGLATFLLVGTRAPRARLRHRHIEHKEHGHDHSRHRSHRPDRPGPS